MIRTRLILIAALFFTVAVGLVLAIAAAMLLVKKQMNLSSTVALTLILSGGVGNLIDRIAFCFSSPLPKKRRPFK